MSAAAILPLTQRKPAEPFYFNTSSSLLRVTRQKASTIGELLDALQVCPDGSVFQHSIQTLQEHHFIREGFSNDFSHWAASACDEPILAEKLASVDVREFTSLADLRNRFIDILNDFLKEVPGAAGRAAKEDFYFCETDTIVIPTSFVARTLTEFVKGLQLVSVRCIYHHFIEARLRLKLMSNDFSQWLHEEMGLNEAAHELNRIDIYTATFDDVREQIVRVVERATI